VTGVDPRYLEPPDLYADEPECPECDVALDDHTCPRCGVTWDADALRDLAEARDQPDEDWGTDR